MSGYEITLSITALCPCCGKELLPSSYLTESKPSAHPLDRDNPFARKDRRVFITPCADCFAPVAKATTTPCEDCNGTGEVGDEIPQGEFQPPERERCESCNGTGHWVLPAAETSGLSDAQILALNAGERFFSESPSRFPEAGHGTQYHAGARGVIGFAREVLTLADKNGGAA